MRVFAYSVHTIYAWHIDLTYASSSYSLRVQKIRSNFTMDLSFDWTMMKQSWWWWHLCQCMKCAYDICATINKYFNYNFFSLSISTPLHFFLNLCCNFIFIYVFCVACFHLASALRAILLFRAEQKIEMACVDSTCIVK